MSIAPFLPTPLTDFGWILSPSFHFVHSDGLCAKLTSKYIDCLDAYGIVKGKEKCMDLFYDIHECSTHTFQRRRAAAIRKERMKQYREGKLKEPYDQHPPLDSFLYLY